MSFSTGTIYMYVSVCVCVCVCVLFQTIPTHVTEGAIPKFRPLKDVGRRLRNLASTNHLIEEQQA
jgi:hypothetical protein